MSDMKSTINFGYLIFLSVVAALGGFLFGYDTAVISGTIAQVTQLFQLDTLQQGWYVGCALIGSIHCYFGTVHGCECRIVLWSFYF